ncbi:hypothetical protein [Chryseobacterium defluvii]|uniref:Uncharacterized protein n=1 Tax=Chryseobacterium defluvii TaxID=160396 RepID=A0A495SLA1_9FLAO|nr:hypothetical protein [Chryseobacterium defluvii]RKT01079.1 hypothetical protein BCF58_0290 [Chryseobacterium defluvii]
MNPKTQANDLIIEFIGYEIPEGASAISRKQAIQFSLNLAKKLKDEVYDIYQKTGGDEYARKRFHHWHEVIQELEKR